jgi:hypothetical protein
MSGETQKMSSLAPLNTAACVNAFLSRSAVSESPIRNLRLLNMFSVGCLPAEAYLPDLIPLHWNSNVPCDSTGLRSEISIT